MTYLSRTFAHQNPDSTSSSSAVADLACTDDASQTGGLMPYCVEVEPEFTRLVFTGDVEFPDCVAAIRAQRQRPTRLGLWDFSRIDGFHLTVLHIRALVSDSTSIARPPGARVAVLTGSDQVFGMAQMAEAYAEIEKLNQAVRVFRDGEAALAWLRGEPSPKS